ncbi:MAG: hypothetical protein AAGA85_20190 [Bacteroidota bacterium]
MKKLRNTVIVWVAIYPAITGLSWLFGDALGALPLAVRTLILTAILVPLMVYVLIPFWTHLLQSIELRWKDHSTHNKVLDTPNH